MMPFYPEMHQCMVGQIKPTKHPLKILELGCGTGALTYLLAKQFPSAQIVALDSSDEMVKKAKSKLGRNGNISYRTANIQDYDWDQKYDVVISALAIHHLSGEEKRDYFTKVFANLKPGGQFIIGDIAASPKEEEWHCYLVDAMGEEGEYRWQQHKNNPLDKPSSIEEHLLWLNMAGFSDIEVIKEWFNFIVISADKGERK
jgi:tRNA (cmo5U34)-methyltransferase